MLNVQGTPASFSASGVTGGAIQSHYRNTTVGAISSVSDVLGVGAAAAQPTGARQPTGNADSSMTFDADCLLIPRSTANNGLVKIVWAFWLELDNLTVQHYLVRLGPGASNDGAATDSMSIRVNTAEQLIVRIYNDATGALARETATPINTLTGGPQFFTVETDLAAAEADKVVITAELTELVTTPVDILGTPGAFPTVMQGAPEDIMFGNRRSNLSTLPFIGRASRGIYCGSGVKQAGAVRGLLSAAGRAALRANEPLA
jgi:hypothetical protein